VEKRRDQYGFHVGVRSGWGTFQRNGLFHTSMARTLTYLTDIKPEESTAFIAGSHKLSEEISQEDIINCAAEDESLIHHVTANAGDTVLFSESLIHSAPRDFSGRERIMITGVFTPPMYQTWNRYDMDRAELEKLESRYRTLFSGSNGWTWQQKVRPTLGAKPQANTLEHSPVHSA
jgi:ectoine hydroxylase-related dioxygenase (phytanoyl-CoA dioxygenase family)